MIIKKAASSGNSSVQWVKRCWKILMYQCCYQRHLIHSARDLYMRKSSQGMAGGGFCAWTKTVDGGLTFLSLLSQEVSLVILDSSVEIHLNLGRQVFVCRHVDLELCEANENAALITRKSLILLNSLDTSRL